RGGLPDPGGGRRGPGARRGGRGAAPALVGPLGPGVGALAVGGRARRPGGRGGAPAARRGGGRDAPAAAGAAADRAAVLLDVDAVPAGRGERGGAVAVPVVLPGAQPVGVALALPLAEPGRGGGRRRPLVLAGALGRPAQRDAGRGRPGGPARRPGVAGLTRGGRARERRGSAAIAGKGRPGVPCRVDRIDGGDEGAGSPRAPAGAGPRPWAGRQPAVLICGRSRVISRKPTP